MYDLGGDGREYEELFERTVQGMVHGSYIPIPKIVKKKKKSKNRREKDKDKGGSIGDKQL